MKFLFDEIVSTLLDDFVKSLGHEIVRFPQGTEDKDLLRAAAKDKLVVVTHDQDFAVLSPRDTEGVLLLRIHPTWSEDVSRGLKNFLAQESPSAWKGKLVLIQKKGFAIVP